MRPAARMRTRTRGRFRRTHTPVHSGTVHGSSGGAPRSSSAAREATPLPKKKVRVSSGGRRRAVVGAHARLGSRGRAGTRTGGSRRAAPRSRCPASRKSRRRRRRPARGRAQRGIDLVAPRATVRAVGVPLLVLRLEVRERPARARDVGAAAGHRQPPQLASEQVTFGGAASRATARQSAARSKALTRYARREESRELAGAAAGVDEGNAAVRVHRLNSRSAATPRFRQISACTARTALGAIERAVLLAETAWRRLRPILPRRTAPAVVHTTHVHSVARSLASSHRPLRGLGLLLAVPLRHLRRDVRLRVRERVRRRRRRLRRRHPQLRSPCSAFRLRPRRGS